MSAAIEAGLVPESMQKAYQEDVSRGAVANIIINLIEQASGMSIESLMAEKGVETDPGAFTDTDDPAVLAANALGIIQGMGDRKFNPEGTLLRAQMAAIICRVANVLGVDTGGYNHSFSDIAGHWVEAEIGWPVHMKIIRGMSPTEFNPDGNLTTEQAIAIIYRTYAALSAGGEGLENEPEKISINSPLVAGKEIPILMYHAIAEEPTTEMTELFVRPSEMEKQIKYLVDNGFQTITFEDLDNIGAFPKPVMITFDDGYECNYNILFPLLKKYNVKATIFAVAGSVWSKGRLSESQIKEMSDSGLVSIQSHTVSHPDLTSLEADKLDYELSESKERIEKLTGKPVIALAYPSGDNDAEVRAAAAKYYDYAVLDRGGTFLCGGDTMAMERIYIWRGMSVGQIAWLLD
ncbi:MAG TPA: polysaccharide deacetylase family protein [Clostridiales bacterium]|nr:polysaccharide deacetylase family protein [Clostridiales bacterium]